MKSRKQLEAQQRMKKEQEEKMRIRNEELRLEAERRKREQQEREEYEARLKHERMIREIELTKQHRERTASILIKSYEYLARSSAEEWHLKQFQWCMRCDGLPDPTNLPQLNAYRYRWLETDNDTEPTIERLLQRAPELNQVINDLNELLENTHDLPEKKIQQLTAMRYQLSELLSQEINAAIKSVLDYVAKHIATDETILNVQTTCRSFSLALGTDTAKNSSVSLHDFPRLGVKVDLPLLVLANERPVVIAFVWLKEGHFLDPPLLNGVPSLPSLLRPFPPDDPLYEYVTETVRTNDGAPLRENNEPLADSIGVQTTNPTDEDMVAKEVDLDLDYYLIVSGVMQAQLIQLPTQPKCYGECTVAPLENGDKLQHLDFIADFSWDAAAKEAAEKASKGGKNNDDDEEGNDGKETNEELRKLIGFRIKLPTSSFWFTCPRPVIYQPNTRTWKSKGVWDVRFFEEIGGPSVQFRIEEPSIVGLAQPKRINFPLQSWTLFPSHLRNSVMHTIVNKASAETTKGSTEKGVGAGGGGGGGGGGGEGWEQGMSDESDDEDEDPGASGGLSDPQALALDEQDEIEYDPEARSVTLTLSGAVVSLDIEIQERQVLLRRARTSACISLQDITNKPMTPFDLVKTLRRRGLEISPSRKVTAQIEELAKNKNQQLERNVYRCIAALAATEKFSFLHSRWNSMAGDDNFVVQYQVLEKENLTTPALAQVSPENARLLPYNESSLSLEQDNVNKDTEIQFYADLLNALYETAPTELKNDILNPSPTFVETIYTMMEATRPITTA